MNVKLNIQAIHFEAREELKNFIEKKINKLPSFYDQIISAEVILKLEKKDPEKNKVVEIMLSVPGNDLFADARAELFEKATDMAVEKLRKMLIKQKEKLSV